MAAVEMVIVAVVVVVGLPVDILVAVIPVDYPVVVAAGRALDQSGLWPKR